MMNSIPLTPLTSINFASFGDIIAPEQAKREFEINQGYATRFHDLANLDLTAQEGRAGVSIFAARQRMQPVQLSIMERHPLSSQAFIPLSGEAWLAVVAPAGVVPSQATQLTAFLVPTGVGLNYAKGVWHHPLLVLSDCQFLIVDRLGTGANLDEVDITSWQCQIVLPVPS